MSPELGAGLDRVWLRLAAAVKDRAAPLRTPVVATAGDGRADGRVMVLRAIDRAPATLTFYTDSRATKVAAVAAAPVAVIGYDAGDGLQLRMSGVAAVVAAGAAADAAWTALGPAARNAYRTAAAPGTPAGSPATAARLDGDGRATFALLVVTLAEIEWLDLAGPVHRRARYHRTATGWDAQWRVP